MSRLENGERDGERAPGMVLSGGGSRAVGLAMFVLFSLAGVLLDLLIQMFALLSAGAVVGQVVRGEPVEAWGVTLMCLGIGIGGLTLLVRRIWKRTRVLVIPRAGTEEVSTVTWLHFVCDALWIALAAMMLSGAQAPAWDSGTRAAAITVLCLCVALGSLRGVARVRAARSGD